MAAMIALGAYGNPVSGFKLPTEVFSDATEQARGLGRELAEQTFRNASTLHQKQTPKITNLSKTLLSRGTQATNALVSQKIMPTLKQTQQYVTDQARELGTEMGAAAAQGARSDTMEAVKRWAPWAIGGVAVAGLGIWLLRR